MGKIYYASDFKHRSADEIDRKVGKLNVVRKDGSSEEIARNKLKKEILSYLQGGKTQGQIKRHLEKLGVAGSQVKKRNNMLNLIKGEAKKESEMTWDEKVKAKAAKRARIIGGQNMARRLDSKREELGDKTARVDKHLNSALRDDKNFKTGASHIGAKQRDYKVTSLGGGDERRGITAKQDNSNLVNFSGQDKMSGDSSVKKIDAKSLAGGFGVKKADSGPSSGSGTEKSGGTIPLSKSA